MARKYQHLISEMNLEEKASLLSGANFWNTKSIERLNIPSMMLTDGPHGLRKQAGKADHLGLSESIPATCFPTAAALANSWDEHLLEQVGQALGSEAAANNVSVLLGPGLNIVRDPLAGRAFEYFSEDPFVAGKLAAGMVRGIQQNGVAATPKHFAVNSQEHLRMSIDEVVDERTMREVYLEAFRRVVQEAKPRMLMTSYNKVNGVYANENTHLLQDILHKEWGYDGAIVTDWGGNNLRVKGLMAGSTLEMPSTNGITDAEIVRAVKKGTLNENLVDDQVDAILNVTFSSAEALKNTPNADLDEHHQLAVQAAERSIILLKNDGEVLPLKSGEKVAIVGDFSKVPRYQGAGSSLVNPTRLVSLLDAFADDETVEFIGYEQGFRRAGGGSARLLKQAVELAKRADVVLVYVGLDESKEAEGLDRKTMSLAANQLKLVQALTAVHEKVVIIVTAGGAVEMPFADNVAAIVHGSLAGQGVGKALFNVLTGLRTPSGKLAVTYPFEYQDAPTANYFPGKERTAEHREGLYVGYRYYESASIPVRFPFGFGLSYTSFSYSAIQVDEKGVTFSITNDGKVPGEEIAQVYIRPPEQAVYRPVVELKGFAKVALQPGETKKVTVLFDTHTFAFYATAVKSWVVTAGEYGVEVGASVRDIRLQTRLRVKGVANIKNAALPSYDTANIKNVPAEEFEQLLGRPIPFAEWNRRAKLDADDTIQQLRNANLFGKLLYGVLVSVQWFLFAIRKPYLANNMEFILNMPFSKIPGFTGGKISKKAIQRFLRLI